MSDVATKPSKMLERIAYTIATAIEPNAGLSWCMNADNREKCRNIARSVLVTMFDPTEAMQKRAEGYGWSGVIEGEPALERERGADLWRAMIDEALR